MVARQYLELCSKIPWKISLDELADIPAVPVKRSTGRVVRRSRGRVGRCFIKYYLVVDGMSL
jgi:hypothetical protein